MYDFRNKASFYGGDFLAPRLKPKLEDHPLLDVRDCLFNIFTATLHIIGRSSIRNMSTRNAVVTGTHLSWINWVETKKKKKNTGFLSYVFTDKWPRHSSISTNLRMWLCSKTASSIASGISCVSMDGWNMLWSWDTCTSTTWPVSFVWGCNLLASPHPLAPVAKKTADGLVRSVQTHSAFF